MEEDSRENPYLDPFFVIVFPIAIVIGIEGVVVWFETAVYPKGFIYLSRKEEKIERKKAGVSRNKAIMNCGGGRVFLFKTGFERMAQVNTDLRRDAAMFRQKSVRSARAGLLLKVPKGLCSPWCFMRCNLTECLIRRNVTRIVYILLLLLFLRTV